MCENVRSKIISKSMFNIISESYILLYLREDYQKLLFSKIGVYVIKSQ